MTFSLSAELVVILKYGKIRDMKQFINKISSPRRNLKEKNNNNNNNRSHCYVYPLKGIRIRPIYFSADRISPGRFVPTPQPTPAP